MVRPLAIDLYSGLGGWSSGLMAEGWDCIGFDIERHEYGDEKYPGKLVIQDARTLHGSQFKSAAIIIASPPCTEFSYMAMPWRRAKQIRRALRGEGHFPEGYNGSRTIAELTELFDACFRIQREACEAAGRHIPLIVENVRGAQEWVGRARWNFGSYYIWGDVPALMPPINRKKDHRKSPGEIWNPERPSYVKDHSWKDDRGQKVPGFRFDGSGKSFQTASVNRQICDCENPEPTSGAALVSEECPIHNLYPKAPPDGVKVASAAGRRTAPGNGARFTSRDCGVEAGTKNIGNGFKRDANGKRIQDIVSNAHGSARKAASAMIAKIPEPLSRHIARVYRPTGEVHG